MRPGVTFPDWSAVTSSVVEGALLAMAGSDHVLNRWNGYDPTTDRVRVALLQLYVEQRRAPSVGMLAERTGLGETALRPFLEELRRRDLVVLDGNKITGAYPFPTAKQATGLHWMDAFSMPCARSTRSALGL